MGIALLYCVPVWTEEIDIEATDFTKAATAPYLAAL